MWHLIRPLLFYSGETTEIADDKKQNKVTSEETDKKERIVKRKIRSTQPFDI